VRLHVPSYLVPGTWLENLRRVEGLEWISGVELLFFSYDSDARAILRRELREIGSFADRLRLTLHLPDALAPEHEELVAATRAFVSSYVIHPPRDRGDLEAWARLVESWRSTYGRDFYLEYTGRDDFAAAEEALDEVELCADTGRLLLDGVSPASWIAERRARVSEVHLHAVRGGRDHAALRCGEPWLEELAPRLADFRGPVEVEVFSLDGADESRRTLDSVQRVAEERGK